MTFIKTYWKEFIIGLQAVIIIVFLFAECNKPEPGKPVIIQSNFILPIPITSSNSNCAEWINKLNPWITANFRTEMNGEIQTIWYYQKWMKQTMPAYYFDNMIILNADFTLNNFSIGWDVSYYRRWFNLFYRPFYAGLGTGQIHNEWVIKIGIAYQW